MNLQHSAAALVCALTLTACTTSVVTPVQSPAGSGTVLAPAPAPATVAPSPSPGAVNPAPQLPSPVVEPPPAAPSPPAATPVSSLLASVQAAVAAGDFERGAAISERALRISPRDAQLWYQLALIRFRQNRFDEAANTAKRALALAGGDSELQRQINALLEQISG